MSRKQFIAETTVNSDKSTKIYTTNYYQSSENNNDNDNDDDNGRHAYDELKTHWSSYFITINTNRVLSMDDQFVSAVTQAFMEVTNNIREACVECPLTADGVVDKVRNRQAQVLEQQPQPPEGYIRSVHRSHQWEEGPKYHRTHMHAVIRLEHKGFIRMLGGKFQQQILQSIAANYPEYAAANLYINVKYFGSGHNAIETYINKKVYNTKRIYNKNSIMHFRHSDAVPLAASTPLNSQEQ